MTLRGALRVLERAGGGGERDHWPRLFLSPPLPKSGARNSQPRPILRRTTSNAAAEYLSSGHRQLLNCVQLPGRYQASPLDRGYWWNGSGIPFYRLERLEEQLGIPLPAATQWEIVEEEAEVIKAARDELIRQAANGEVLHNDDTRMRVLKMEREPGDQRTGVFTSGIVSTTGGRQIALYFTGRQHAGENIADVLKQRARESGPAIQMCDALSWNAPKLPAGVELLVAHCLAHGRRQVVE